MDGPTPHIYNFRFETVIWRTQDYPWTHWNRLKRPTINEVDILHVLVLWTKDPYNRNLLKMSYGREYGPCYYGQIL